MLSIYTTITWNQNIYWTIYKKRLFKYIKYRNIDFLIGAYGLSWKFYIENETVNYRPLEDNFNLFVKEFKKWYNADLIEPGVLRIIQEYIIQKQKNNYGIYLDYISRIETYSNEIKKNGQPVKLIPLRYPVLKKGDIPFSGHLAPIFSPFSSCYISTEVTKIKWQMNYSQLKINLLGAEKNEWT